uniref:Uncharacterized protein n=1 Tax=Panagrellus redivivus TaxID=6233 RepID=A0A7E4UME3_PANRE
MDSVRQETPLGLAPLLGRINMAAVGRTMFSTYPNAIRAATEENIAEKWLRQRRNCPNMHTEAGNRATRQPRDWQPPSCRSRSEY